MDEIISQSEFAKRIGKSRQYVSKLALSGRLVLDGKKVDYKKSLSIMKSEQDPARDGQRAWSKTQKGDGPKKASLKKQSGVIKSGTGKNGPGRSDGIDPKVLETSKALQQAKLQKEINDSKLKELEYKKAVGEVLPISQVVEANAKIAEIVRTKLLSIPNKVAPIIINMKTIPEIESYLQNNINDILEELYNLSGVNGNDRENKKNVRKSVNKKKPGVKSK